jgi:uncharacterized protein YcbK (DUF882 family)
MAPLERRAFLAGAVSATAFARPALASIGGARRLAFDNLHTGERLSLEYWTQGAYVPAALASINHLLRDFRTGDVHAMEPRLLDLLNLLQTRLETNAPFAVISGYRSPATNTALRALHRHSGVASKSLHMQGMAIDIRVPGRALETVHKAALTLRAGGVGYYPQSDFVHVDVGRIRTWRGS